MFEHSVVPQFVIHVYEFEWDESKGIKDHLRSLQEHSGGGIKFYFPGDHWLIVETRVECKAFWHDTRGRLKYKVVLTSVGRGWEVSHVAYPVTG